MLQLVTEGLHWEHFHQNNNVINETSAMWSNGQNALLFGAMANLIQLSQAMSQGQFQLTCLSTCSKLSVLKSARAQPEPCCNAAKLRLTQLSSCELSQLVGVA